MVFRYSLHLKYIMQLFCIYVYIYFVVLALNSFTFSSITIFKEYIFNVPKVKSFVKLKLIKLFQKYTFTLITLFIIKLLFVNYLYTVKNNTSTIYL